MHNKSSPPLARFPCASFRRFRFRFKDNNVHTGFEMKMTNVCLDSGSDLEQIDKAGGTQETC